MSKLLRGEKQGADRARSGWQRWCVTALCWVAGCASEPRALPAGYAHSCVVLETGEVTCWGCNQFGQLGNGSTGDRFPPVRVRSVSDATAVAVGAAHSCALLRDGRVLCWGLDAPERSGSAAIEIPTLANATVIAAGSVHTCAIVDGGRIACWGGAYWQRIVDIAGNMHLSPTYLGLSIEFATALAVGDERSCAIVEGGRVRCWNNLPVQLTNGVFEPATFLLLATTEAVDLAANGTRTCAALRDGTVRCWNAHRQTEASFGITDAAQVAVGVGHTCVLTRSAQVACWGRNVSGQLGVENTTRISIIPGSHDTVRLLAGGAHTCGVLRDGTVRCSGDNQWGQLGDLGIDDQTAPVFVQGITNAR